MAVDDKIATITTGFLNTVNDPVPGELVSSGTGVAQRGGLLGRILPFNHASVPWVTTQLYGGRYQYVQEYATSSGATAAGQVAFWYDEANYVVTADAGSGRIAGIYLSVITKGYYGWIQRSGLATVKFRATITKATPAIGDLVIVQNGYAVGEILDDATALTSVEVRAILGVAKAAPTGGGSSLVELWERYVNV